MKRINYRREKEQGGKESKENKAGLSARVILYCIIITVVLYVLMIFIEKSVINADDNKIVYVAVKEVPENILVTEENIGTYFEAKERALSAVPDKAIENGAELYGMYTDRVINKNEIVTGESFSSLDERTKDIEHPIEVSLNASNLSQLVGGVLRTGDYINIWSVKSNTINGEKITETKNICSHVYVTRTFSSSGEIASEDNADMATMIVNIIIPAEQEEEFNTAIVEGTLRVGRYLYDYAVD
jgi:hypothetical protein